MKHNTLVFALVTTLSATLLSGCSSPDNPTPPPLPSMDTQNLAAYGKMCAVAIRDLPAFNCHDGTMIPITVDGGKTPANYTANMDCDRPSLLPLENKQGQCIPFSRVLDLSNGDAQVAVLCRQKTIRTEQSPFFDEIDIVAHNAKDGSTCWFQASGTENQPLDGTNVPSPMALKSAGQYQQAMQYWQTPKQVHSAGCGNCHDNEPVMFSPFVGQVWDKVPTDPFGWYKHLGVDFKDWQPVSLSTRDNTCVSCHRLGVDFTSGKATLEATGQIPIPNANAWAKTYPNSHFMPVGNFHSKAQWDEIYQQAVKDILACHANPKSEGCLTSAITGKP